MRTLTNIVLFLIAMGFFSNLFGGGERNADSFKEPESGIEFPMQVGIFKRGTEKWYEAEPGRKSVAIPYHAPNGEMTVYVRALGDDADKTAEYFLRDTLASIKTLEERGEYANVKIYESDPAKEIPGWRSAAFTSKGDDHFLASFINCRVLPHHMIKIRATTGGGEYQDVHAAAREMQELINKAVPATP